MTGLWAFEVQLPFQKYQGSAIVVRCMGLRFGGSKYIRYLFMSFGTIFRDFNLGWCYDILIWKLGKQTSYWSKTGFLSQLIIIINFHTKIWLYYHYKITSQNIVPKDMNKFSKDFLISSIDFRQCLRYHNDIFGQ